MPIETLNLLGEWLFKCVFYWPGYQIISGGNMTYSETFLNNVLNFRHMFQFQPLSQEVIICLNILYNGFISWLTSASHHFSNWNGEGALSPGPLAPHSLLQNTLCASVISTGNWVSTVEGEGIKKMRAGSGPFSYLPTYFYYLQYYLDYLKLRP